MNKLAFQLGYVSAQVSLTKTAFWANLGNAFEDYLEETAPEVHNKYMPRSWIGTRPMTLSFKDKQHLADFHKEAGPHWKKFIAKHHKEFPHHKDYLKQVPTIKHMYNDSYITG